MPKKPESKPRRLRTVIRFDPDIYAKLAQTAEALGTTISDIINEILRDHFEHGPH